MTELKTYEDIAEAVFCGYRVVIQAVSHRSRIELGREIMQSTHRGWCFAPSQNNILKSGDRGGFLHIVIDPEEARGMEYHMSFGYVNEKVRARVRL